jgi:hypothetical protein
MANIETYLNNLSYLKNTLIVDCKLGNLSIEETQDKMYQIEIFPENFKFKTSTEVSVFCGEISKISILDHDTDEEEIVYQM